MFNNIKERAEAYVDEVWEDAVADIATLVSIPSVENPEQAGEGCPWGPESRRALDAGLVICEKLGLETHNCDGYIGYADLAGESQTQIATIAHTDVVPEGLGWHGDPFTMQRKEGYLVGRGVQDDKGSFVLSAYACHFFKRMSDEAGKPLPYTLRCIVGNCEETAMGDLEYYLANFEAPAFCFSPDADFPLVCGEKGIFQGLFTSSVGAVSTQSVLAELEGGTVPNAIPSQATALVRRDAATIPVADGIEIEAASEGLAKIIAHGIGGHAAFPEGTDNAIGKLVRFLLEQELYSPEQEAFLRLAEQLTRTSDGSEVGLACADEIFGPLTLNAGVARTQDSSFTLTIDVRFPRCISSDSITKTFERMSEQAAGHFDATTVFEPFYMDPSMPEVQALLSSYNSYFGRNDEPLVIGGGTYARHFPKAVAFGPCDPQCQKPAWAGTEHGPDEAIAEDTLKSALVVYIMAIAKLMQLDL